jgi:hypothetical protein
MADRLDGQARARRGRCLRDVDHHRVADDEERGEQADGHDDAERDHDLVAEALARLGVAGMRAGAGPAALHPGRDHDPGDEGEAAEGDAHRHPEEVRDVGRGMAVRVERVLLAAAAGQHERCRNRGRRDEPSPRPSPRCSSPQRILSATRATLAQTVVTKGTK